MIAAYSASIVFFAYWLSRVERGSLFSAPSDFYEKEYVHPNTADIKFERKRNVLMIVLESMEKSYSDKKLFGQIGLIPNLERIENENISFSNYNEYDGMTFTIGAIIGMLSGVPLLYNGSGRTVKAINAIGIGNILQDNGYDTYAFFSSSGRYTNKESTFRNKGFQNIIGGDLIKKPDGSRKTFDKNYYGGTDDMTMFKFAKGKISKIDKTKPYFILMETINTHIDGYHVKSCEQMGFSQKTFVDIVKCEDKIILDFVEWFKTFDKDAVVVLINDHNTKNAMMNKRLAHVKNRTLSNAFIGTDIFDGAKTSRPIFAPDFFPTIIEVAGGSVFGCRLGLGTSLSKKCSDVKNLRERYGDKKLRILLKSRNKLYNRLMGIK